MKNEYIPHQQALALTELGYNYSVEFYKDDSEELFDMRTPNDAPCILWQQAFRWFRKKHKLHTWVTSKTIDEVNTIYIPHGRTLPDTMNKNLVVDVIPYVTFKEERDAEIECLKKLIEIVKEKL